HGEADQSGRRGRLVSHHRPRDGAADHLPGQPGSRALSGTAGRDAPPIRGGRARVCPHGQPLPPVDPDTPRECQLGGLATYLIRYRTKPFPVFTGFGSHQHLLNHTADPLILWVLAQETLQVIPKDLPEMVQREPWSDRHYGDFSTL